MIRSQGQSRHTPVNYRTAGDIDRARTEDACRLGAVDLLVMPAGINLRQELSAGLPAARV